jgi:anti-sigma regulatory factor (Ser/Thr protein kinase)
VTQRFIGLSVFATLCYARLDLARGQMVLVDCGHTKTLHIQRHTGRCTILQGDNMPLGFSAQEIYRQVVFPLSGGDILIFYSDGVTEARNTAGEFFGVDRLIEVIQAKHHLQPQELIDAIHTAIRAFTQVETSADDLTCIAVSLAETGDVLVPVPSDRSAASSEPGEANLLAHAQTEITSSMAELPLLRAFVRTFCQDLPVLVLDEDSLGQLELAVTEAASNIMKHAYHGRTDRRIQVTADAFPDRIVIRLSHGGMAFDPKTVKPPAFDGSRESGFGVYIIAHAVDEVHYDHGEAGGHGIRLVKKRKNPMNRGRSYGADV